MTGKKQVQVSIAEDQEPGRENQESGEQNQELPRENVPPSESSYLKCSERIPTSESDSFGSQLSVIEFDPEDCNVVGEFDNSSEYERTDLIPFPVLLRTHPKQLVSGFEFGEATRRQAEQNMKAARDNSLKIEEPKGYKTDDEQFSTASCSKAISELDHKTPHSQKRKRRGEWKLKVPKPDADFSSHSRGIPAPLQDYPDCIEVWNYMIYKEEANMKLRNHRLFHDFKGVTPRMRAILLDWLMEVAEVYHLRRVTYYLSVDYFDRYLSIRPNIPKSSLQLVGITCLYIAAKVEEIYPPNLSEFSYVCDGACKSSDMVACELLILNSLGWEVISTIPSDWLNLFMQMHHKQHDVIKSNLSIDFNKDFIYPKYSAYQFTRASQLMDLFSLDPGFLKFSYSVVAASAIYFMYGKQAALSVSGLTWEQLKHCVEYMSIFYEVIRKAPDPRLKSCLNEALNLEDVKGLSEGLLRRMKTGPQNSESYAIQTHVASMEYFEKATIIRLAMENAIPAQMENNKSKTDIKPLEDVETSQYGESSNNKILKADEINSSKNDLSPKSENKVISKEDECQSTNELSHHENKVKATEPVTESTMNIDEIFEYFLKKDSIIEHQDVE